ncbi:MAG: hypothetical protein HY069_02285 [Chlamydiia bacterium]|nr:hypothetical protein [Chlamydiia bacterium]
MYLWLMLCSLFAQTSTYLGPKQPAPGTVQVQLSVQNSPELGGVAVVSARFDGQDIPLKPADVNGYRGGANFQVTPGKYKLEWVVQKSKIYWPRTVSHEELVTISGQDVWVQINLVGETATIH